MARTCPQRARLWLRFRSCFSAAEGGAGAGAEGHRAGGPSAVPDLPESSSSLIPASLRKTTIEVTTKKKNQRDRVKSVDRLQQPT